MSFWNASSIASFNKTIFQVRISKFVSLSWSESLVIMTRDTQSNLNPSTKITLWVFPYKRVTSSKFSGVVLIAKNDFYLGCAKYFFANILNIFILGHLNVQKNIRIYVVKYSILFNNLTFRSEEIWVRFYLCEKYILQKFLENF